MGFRRYLVKDYYGNTDERMVEEKLNQRFPGHRCKVVALRQYNDGRLKWYRAEPESEITEMRTKIAIEIQEKSLHLEVIEISTPPD
ncbi:hypothetical protein KW797_01710 [Candidatus Parcubacteria bacterium]|nr:hypothetical protein [Candidatus Parcubacteria bacterium]